MAFRGLWVETDFSGDLSIVAKMRIGSKMQRCPLKTCHFELNYWSHLSDI